MFQEVEHLKKTIEEAKPEDISQEASSKLSFTLEYSVERGAFDIVVEQRLWYYHCTVKSRCCNNIASKLCCYKVCLLHAWNINTLIVAKYLHVKPHSQPPTQLFIACWTVKQQKAWYLSSHEHGAIKENFQNSISWILNLTKYTLNIFVWQLPPTCIAI